MGNTLETSTRRRKSVIPKQYFFISHLKLWKEKFPVYENKIGLHSAAAVTPRTPGLRLFLLFALPGRQSCLAISVMYSDTTVHMWPHTQTQTRTRGSKNSFSFPAKISTSNHCTPEGMTHDGLTNDSDFLLQPPKHSGYLLSSPQRGIGAEERWWNSLLPISPHCCERTLRLCFLFKGQAGEGPDRHPGVPFLTVMAGHRPSVPPHCL